MTKQIDELMALFDEAAEANFDQGLHKRKVDAAPEEKREAFRQSLEAALRACRNATLEEVAGVCNRFQERDMQPAECAGAIRFMKS
jgi:hypothetical protein